MGFHHVPTLADWLLIQNTNEIPSDLVRHALKPTEERTYSTSGYEMLCGYQEKDGFIGMCHSTTLAEQLNVLEKFYLRPGMMPNRLPCQSDQPISSKLVASNVGPSPA